MWPFTRKPHEPEEVPDLLRLVVELVRVTGAHAEANSALREDLKSMEEQIARLRKLIETLLAERAAPHENAAQVAELKNLGDQIEAALYPTAPASVEEPKPVDDIPSLQETSLAA